MGGVPGPGGKVRGDMKRAEGPLKGSAKGAEPGAWDSQGSHLTRHGWGRKDPRMFGESRGGPGQGPELKLCPWLSPGGPEKAGCVRRDLRPGKDSRVRGSWIGRA